MYFCQPCRSRGSGAETLKRPAGGTRVPLIVRWPGRVPAGTVVDAPVNLAMERASVTYDESVLSPSTVIDAVRELGYSPLTEEFEIGVGGMTCANCSARVERALNKLPGGLEASVNLYHFMHIVLADNAIARSKTTSKAVPRLRACFHVGSCYEFHQAEGLLVEGDAFLQVQRLPELVEIADLDIGAVLERPALRLELAEQQPQQRRLARSAPAADSNSQWLQLHFQSHGSTGAAGCQ